MFVLLYNDVNNIYGLSKYIRLRICQLEQFIQKNCVDLRNTLKLLYQFFS